MSLPSPEGVHHPLILQRALVHLRSVGPFPLVHWSDTWMFKIPQDVFQLVRRGMIRRANLLMHRSYVSMPDPHDMIALPTHFDSYEHHTLLDVSQQLRTPVAASQESSTFSPVTGDIETLVDTLQLPRNEAQGIPYRVQDIHDTRNVYVDGNMKTCQKYSVAYPTTCC
jgi:hypothetical protein